MGSLVAYTRIKDNSICTYCQRECPHERRMAAMIRQQGISRTVRRPRGVSVGSMTAAPRRNKETARAAPTERRTSCKRKQGPSGEPETAVAGTRPCRFRNGRGLTQTIAPPLDARNASKVVASSSPAMSFNRYAGTRRSTRSISSAFPSPVAAQRSATWSPVPIYEGHSGEEPDPQCGR